MQILDILHITLQYFSNAVKHSYLALLAVALLSLLTDMIEFLQIVSLYIFLETELPSNFRVVLEFLYEQLNINLIPLSPPSFIASNGANFNPNGKLLYYDFDLNLLSFNYISLLQIMLMVIYYPTMKWLLAQANCQNRLVVWLRSKFEPRLYSNITHLLLGAQIMLCFSGAAVFRDRHYNHKYKLVNAVMAVSLAFLSVVVVAVHPTILNVLKQQTKEDTAECYSKAKRTHLRSEAYVCSGMISRTVAALSIPLLPAAVSIILMTCSGVW